MPCTLCNDAIGRESQVDVRHTFDVLKSANYCVYCQIIADVLTEHNVEAGQRLHITNDSNTSTSRATGGIKILVIKKGQIYGSQFDFVIRNLRGCDSGALQAVLFSGLTYTGSQQAIEWAKLQIETCERAHSTCKVEPHVRPDRLLRIGRREADNNDWLESAISLYESRNEIGPYATLSHRWGHRQPLRLLKENIADFQKCIPWADLPKTFQQAIHFARRLNIDYLWIDSLCIIQNSKEDWEEQALKMASIYEHSHLTLAASVAENSEAGCFVEPPEFLSGYVTDGITKIGCKDQEAVMKLIEGAEGRALMFIRGASEHLMPSAGLPLLTRGWVLQERLLSPRLLHFSNLDVIYECSWRTECYCKKQVGAATRSVRHHPLKLQHANALGNGMFKGVGGTFDDYAQRWCAIIEEYSALDLTFASDRLPALAGLARQMARYMPAARYLSGIWTTHVAVYLLWQRKNSAPSVNAPQIRSGPSWSWATMPGQLYFPSGSFFLQNSAGYDPSADPSPKVIRIDFDSEGPKDFMSLQDGGIHLEGVLLKVRLVKMHGNYQLDEVCIVPSDQGRRFVEVVLDHNPEDEEVRDDWETIAQAQEPETRVTHAGDSTPTQSLRPPEVLDPSYPFHPGNRPLRRIIQHKELMWIFCLGTWHVDGRRNDQFLLLQRIKGCGQAFRRIGSGSDDAKHSLFRGGVERQNIELR